jgi:hypothetical protein
MDTPMNQPNAPMNPMPEKKGHAGLITAIILILIVLAVLLFWSKDGTEVEAPTTADTTQQEESSDLSSLEADLEATYVEGVSEGL